MENKSTKKQEDRTFNIFKFITESIAWVQIVASPFLIGLLIGGIIYFQNKNSTTLFLGILVAVFGLLFGIVWATKQNRKNGTVSFMSRVNASPDFNKKDEKDN